MTPPQKSISISVVIGFAFVLISQLRVFPPHVGEDGIIYLMLLIGFIVGAAVGNYLVFKLHWNAEGRAVYSIVLLIAGCVTCLAIYWQVRHNAGVSWMWLRGILVLAFGATLHSGMILAGVTMNGGQGSAGKGT